VSSQEDEEQAAAGGALSELEAALVRALATVPREQVVRTIVTSLPVELHLDESTPLHGGRVQKVSVSMPEELAEAVRARAGAGGFSRYVSEVVEREIRHERLGRLLDELEAEFGQVPPEIREQTRREWPNYEEDEDEDQ
jgi:hypothetical protein